MSGDEFSTVNARSRGEKAREVEALRQRYKQQRDELVKMIADIDRALAGLDDEILSAAPAAALKSEPGMRPLVAPPRAAAAEPTGAVYDDDEADRESRLRVVWIVVAALVALALIGWLIWKASSDRAPEGAVIETATETTIADTTTAPTTTIAEETAPPPARALLSITPESADYGVIRKGTRATRQFEIANDGEEPVAIALARSACRCLYYEYAEVVPPKGKETITVTVDGAKAAAGDLRESVRVTAKRDPSIVTTFEVNATIR